MKKKNNYACLFVVVLSVALAVNLVFYALPESLFGLGLKKVDLLSDIRAVPEAAQPEYASLQAFEDSVPERERASVPLQSDARGTNASPVSDCFSNQYIEDFAPESAGLKHFFEALNSADKLNRPVRIAFAGDSFIEGDILVADFRAKMQERFGGRGVGFIPATSDVMQFRSTIKQQAKGWKTYSILHNKNRKYTLSGQLFEPEKNDASIRFQMVDAYYGLNESSSLKILYAENKSARIRLINGPETITDELPPTKQVTQYEMQGGFASGTLQFGNARGLHIIGLALEDDYGVTVDNLPLRGNSGLAMSTLDRDACRQLQEVRPYDLIVLQYGLNVADNSVSNYGWYRTKMVAMIAHLRDCFPDVDLLLLGVSDRSRKQGNGYGTMPAVLSLLRTQQHIARDANTTFWSVFAAMGGKNSMVKYVKANRASKDYTHLNFRGGREIANVLYKAIMKEKERYDEKQADKPSPVAGKKGGA